MAKKLTAPPKREPVYTGAYVVSCVEHLRDGIECYAKLFHSKEEALDWLNGYAERCFAFENHNFQLFQLGAEIKLESANIEEPQPSKLKRKFKLGEVIQ